MDLHAILIRAPVNKLAASVVSQRGAAPDLPLSRDELIYLLERLWRRHRLLKMVLGIKTKNQHNKVMWKFNKGKLKFRQSQDPRAFAEYRLVGQQIQSLFLALADIRRSSLEIATAEESAA